MNMPEGEVCDRYTILRMKARLDAKSTLLLKEYDKEFHCGTVYTGVINKAITEAFDEMIVAKPPVPAQQALDKAAKMINDCIANKGQ